MSRQKRANTAKKQHGFTLIEFIIVMSIVVLLTGGIGISLNQANEDVIQMNTALQALADLRFAQETAMSTNRTVRFIVQPGYNRYYAQFLDGSYLQSPITGDNLDVTFPEGVEITSSNVNANLTFEPTGVPMINNDTFGGSVSVMLIDSWKYVVIFSSGYSALDDEETPSSGCGGGCGT